MNGPTSPSRDPGRRHPAGTWLLRAGIGLAVLLVLLALGLWWLLGTGPGLRFVLARASGLTDGALSVGRAEGSVAGPMQLRDVVYRNADGLAVHIAELRADLVFWALPGKRLELRQLALRQVVVTLPPPAPAPASGGGLSLKPPLAIALDQARIDGLRVARNGQPLFRADTIALAGRWDDSGLAVRQLQVRAPDGRVDLHGQVALGAGYRGDGQATFAWRLGDTRYAGRLQATSDGNDARLQLALDAPMGARLDLALDQRSERWHGRLNAPPFDPAPLLGAGRLDTLALDLRGEGRRFGGTINGEVRLNRYHVQLQPLRAQLADDGHTLQLQALQLTSPEVPGTLHAEGRIDLAASPTAGRLQLAWSGVRLPPDLVGQRLDSRGTLTAQGAMDRFQARGDVALGPPGQLARLHLDLDGTPDALTLHSLDIEQPHGRLAAHGTVTLQPAFGWQLDATADHFDPGQLVAGWRGALNARLSTRGTLPAGKPDATLTLDRLDGRLRGRPLRGRGKLHLAPSRVLDGTLHLASGDSTIDVRGKPGPRNDVTAALDLRALGDWLPRAGGRLAGTVHVGGLPPALAVEAHLHGRDLAYAGYQARRLKLDATIPDIGKPGGDLAATARGLRAAGLQFRELTVQAQGTEQAHRLSMRADGRQLSGQLALHGRLAGGVWDGRLTTLDLTPQGLPAWHLQAPVDLHYAKGGFRSSQLCLTAGDPELCATADLAASGALDASYRIRAVPVALLLNAAGYAELPLRVDGALAGDGTIRRDAGGKLSGQATLSSDRGTITYLQQADRPLLGWQGFQLDARFDPDGQQASVHARLDRNGLLEGRATVSGPSQALDGQLTVHLDSLAPLELLTGELANVQGRLDARLSLGSTLAAPAIEGGARIDGFAAEVPKAGLALTDGQLTITPLDAHTLGVDGSVRSGKGTARIAGTVGLGGAPSSIAVTGNQVTVADIPAAHVVVSPALVLGRDGNGLSAVGAVDVDSAEIDLERLPGGGALKGSPDVVVVDAPQPEESPGATPISARVAFDLGQHTHLTGKGLDGKVTGLVTVIEQPGKPTLAQGQLAVTGTYKAYGQDLVIEEGKVAFAHSPIDDPGLDIRAVRKLNPNATIDEGQEVGLHITGTAQRPVVDVFSKPTMDQSDALAYLITGKPLSQVGSGEGNMITSAAQALGSAAGNLLAKSVGSKLGVDEIGVSSSQALGGGSAFTVGKYLSPRLYLSYGVGLFQPGQVITLRYRLSQRWNFEAQNAPDFSRASLNYRLER